jgi:glyoxylase-like metal-dependent hydrolase (beta-lactamase superfamily II)
LTSAGDVIAVGTPGHTADHLAVLVEDQGTTYVLAGDSSYTEQLMLDGQIDGVCIREDVARTTLRAIRSLATDRPTVYLPTHDLESGKRLSNRRLVNC